MTRKDYILIADRLRQAMHRAASTTHAQDLVHRLALDLADDLQADNPNFDRARFLAACRLEG